MIHLAGGGSGAGVTPDKRRQVVLGAGLALGLAAAVLFGARVPIETVALRTGPTDCYLSSLAGELVADDEAGTAVIEENISMKGHHTLVVWPVGYTARRTLLGQIEVVSFSGRSVAWTGDHVNIDGGYNRDGTWDACGLEPIP